MPQETVTLGKPKQPCPHCHSSATPEPCRRCTRDMCEDCISHHHAYGPVCGLCVDQLRELEG